jgi:hypothetical protein
VRSQRRLVSFYGRLLVFELVECLKVVGKGFAWKILGCHYLRDVFAVWFGGLRKSRGAVFFRQCVRLSRRLFRHFFENVLLTGNPVVLVFISHYFLDGEFKI